MDDRQERRELVLALAKLGLTDRNAYRTLRAKTWEMVQSNAADLAGLNKYQSIELN